MDTNKAKNILTRSIKNLQQRRGNITLSDLEAEVINNTCLTILRDRQKKGLHDPFVAISFFTSAAMELFPENYTEKEAILDSFGIQQNLAWEGMWNFLRDYFQKNHGIQIDNTETSSLIFYSTKHKRYEQGIMVTESQVERAINMSFIDEKKELIISIEPSLSPKTSYLVAQSEFEYQYKGYDPDYLFIVNFDDFEEVVNLTLEMPNRNLKIIYFE